MRTHAHAFCIHTQVLPSELPLEYKFSIYDEKDTLVCSEKYVYMLMEYVYMSMEYVFMSMEYVYMSMVYSYMLTEYVYMLIHAQNTAVCTSSRTV